MVRLLPVRHPVICQSIGNTIVGNTTTSAYNKYDHILQSYSLTMPKYDIIEL